jgi:ABC-type Na+ efflux pump permease subunit
MRKIFTIAVREYRAMVGTKAFVASIIMMPVLMGGSIIAMEMLKNVGEIKQRKIAVSDQTGEFFAAIEKAAIERNRILKSMDENRDSSMIDDSPGSVREEYMIEKIDPETMNDNLRVALSNRIKNQDLYAFVEIPGEVLPSNTTNPSEMSGTAEESADSAGKIRFFAQDASLSEAKGWLSRVINETIKVKRLEHAGIDPKLVQLASVPLTVVGMGLVERSADGSIQSAEEADVMKAIFLPMGIMMFMFMVIFMASQPMLESVLEEKSQRIAEVLLGSANPIQLMTGKLIGTVAGSLTVFLIYLAGAYLMCVYRGWTDQIPFELAPWFIVFQVVGVLFYASIFMAIGASVSQLKEAQSMLLPVWMLLMSPMFVWIFIVRDPLGPMATGFSLFPPATPTTMMLRMATGTALPWWQPIVGLVATMLTTILIVFVAARIFRVGILWQGKTPKIGEILKWALMGA